MSECPICANESAKLVSPPEGYCDHEICMECWKNIGERNPLCPVCRCDVTEWLKELKVDIKSKEMYDENENLHPNIFRAGSMRDSFSWHLGRFLLYSLDDSLFGRLVAGLTAPRRYRDNNVNEEEDLANPTPSSDSSARLSGLTTMGNTITPPSFVSAPSRRRTSRLRSVVRYNSNGMAYYMYVPT